MSTLVVCHLVRKTNGPEPLVKFLDSYLAHPAGAEHDLVLLFKGFTSRRISSEYLAVVKYISFKSLFLPDRGFDVGSYFQAASNLSHDYLCFLNSYSIILGDNWLSKLYRPLLRPHTGVVSATGSYQSHYTYLVNSLRELPPGVRPSRSRFRRVVGHQIRQQKLRSLKRDYPEFPNYHIRTNAFVITRDLMLSIEHKRIRNKDDAYRLESGYNGLTQQILKRGLQPLVVGRDGTVYEKEDWRHSRTFRTGGQENLLVADNQTSLFDLADEAKQRDFERIAWEPS